jgi:uncharacterized protein
MKRASLNIFGQPLVECSMAPMTGFFRNGCCDTGPDDRGMHTVCALMTDEFLIFSKAAGNDLSTPLPQYGFAGLKAGDYWCLCVQRWVEAYEAGVAPRLKLSACHEHALEYITIEVLTQYSNEL